MPHSEQVKRTTAVMFFGNAMRPDGVFGAALLNTHSLQRCRLASRLETYGVSGMMRLASSNFSVMLSYQFVRLRRYNFRHVTYNFL